MISTWLLTLKPNSRKLAVNIHTQFKTLLLSLIMYEVKGPSRKHLEHEKLRISGMATPIQPKKKKGTFHTDTQNYTK